MSKSLYEEALADAKKIREHAEESAKRAIIDQVTPKIKELIESQLLGEAEDEEDENVLTDDDEMVPELPGVPGEIVVQDPLANAISMPDENGAVTLDLAALQAATAGEFSSSIAAAAVPASPCAAPPMPGVMPGMAPAVAAPQAPMTALPMDGGDAMGDDEEIELTQESLRLLLPMFSNMGKKQPKIQTEVNKIVSAISDLNKIKLTEGNKKDYTNVLAAIFSKVTNTYKYIQENMRDSKDRTKLEEQLENCYKGLQGIKEFREMAKKNLNEAALTIKVDGFMDDQLNLDELDVTLESDNEEDEDGMAPPGDDLDLSGGDLGGMGDEMEESDMMGMFEGDEVDDDTVVEIDESMLRNEIAKMKRVAEDKTHPAEILADFGGGKDEGDVFLTGDVSTADDVELMEDAGVVAATRALAEAKKAAKAKKDAKSKGKKKVQKEGSDNGLSTQLAESKAANEKLRVKLEEQNLFNAKLLYVNKLLQNESLTPKQRSVAMERIDEARSLREVKLVFESVTKALAAKKTNKLAEGTFVGSSSRAVAKSSPNDLVMESAEQDRWAKLAGLIKG